MSALIACILRNNNNSSICLCIRFICTMFFTHSVIFRLYKVRTIYIIINTINAYCIRTFWLKYYFLQLLNKTLNKLNFRSPSYYKAIWMILYNIQAFCSTPRPESESAWSNSCPCVIVALEILINCCFRTLFCLCMYEHASCTCMRMFNFWIINLQGATLVNASLSLSFHNGN